MGKVLGKKTKKKKQLSLLEKYFLYNLRVILSRQSPAVSDPGRLWLTFSLLAEIVPDQWIDAI